MHLIFLIFFFHHLDSHFPIFFILFSPSLFSFSFFSQLLSIFITFIFFSLLLCLFFFFNWPKIQNRQNSPPRPCGRSFGVLNPSKTDRNRSMKIEVSVAEDGFRPKPTSIDQYSSPTSSQCPKGFYTIRKCWLKKFRKNIEHFKPSLTLNIF